MSGLTDRDIPSRSQNGCLSSRRHSQIPTERREGELRLPLSGGQERLSWHLPSIIFSYVSFARIVSPDFSNGKNGWGNVSLT